VNHFCIIGILKHSFSNENYSGFRYPHERREKWLYASEMPENVKVGFSKILKDLGGVNGFA
jgi:hypothetical protein